MPAASSGGSRIRYLSSCLPDVIISAAVASLSLGDIRFMSSDVANAWRIELAVTGFPKMRLSAPRMYWPKAPASVHGSPVLGDTSSHALGCAASNPSTSSTRGRGSSRTDLRNRTDLCS